MPPIRFIFSMNLRSYLLLNIVLVALVCLMTTTVIVLFRANQESKQAIEITADALSKQLEMQLWRIEIGFGAVINFPDLDFWQETHVSSGICIRYVATNSHQARGICQGDESPMASWPHLFEDLYRLVFNPEFNIKKKVTFKNKMYGSVSVSSSSTRELAYAWESVSALMTVSIMTVLAVCLFVYLSVSRALRPAQVIVHELEKMSAGDLSVRLPHFDVLEWQQTSLAINQLAENQQQLQHERKQLMLQLITQQETERRDLSRELHDELGQCLAALNAHATSARHTATHTCPGIIPDIQNILHISHHVMQTVRELLRRLRPIELDNLGLKEALKNLITEWNAPVVGKVLYQLEVIGIIHDLPDALNANLFRIIQECLTNVAKHSTATLVSVTLIRKSVELELSIADNGHRQTTMLNEKSGLGLIGIHERVNSLAGQLIIEKPKSGGFIVRATFPINL